jgi:DNA-binding LytR/AlgR family response regulator
MIRLAICDDEENELAIEKSVVENVFNRLKLSVEITLYKSGRALLEALRSIQYNIVLLDINMRGMSGFTVAEEIFRQTGGSNLIFVSNEDALVFEALNFRPFGFVRKTNLVNELGNTVTNWIDRNAYNDFLEFKVDKQSVEVALSDIIYMEVKQHDLYIYTENRVIKTRGRISDYDYLVKKNLFIRPHNSFLCNLQYVYEVQKDNVVMTDKSLIHISRGKFEECKRMYLRYARRQD